MARIRDARRHARTTRQRERDDAIAHHAMDHGYVLRGDVWVRVVDPA